MDQPIENGEQSKEEEVILIGENLPPEDPSTVELINDDDSTEGEEENIGETNKLLPSCGLHVQYCISFLGPKVTFHTGPR